VKSPECTPLRTCSRAAATILENRSSSQTSFIKACDAMTIRSPLPMRNFHIGPASVSIPCHTQNLKGCIRKRTIFGAQSAETLNWSFCIYVGYVSKQGKPRWARNSCMLHGVILKHGSKERWEEIKSNVGLACDSEVLYVAAQIHNMYVESRVKQDYASMLQEVFSRAPRARRSTQMSWLAGASVVRS